MSLTKLTLGYIHRFLLCWISCVLPPSRNWQGSVQCHSTLPVMVRAINVPDVWVTQSITSENECFKAARELCEAQSRQNAFVAPRKVRAWSCGFTVTLRLHFLDNYWGIIAKHWGIVGCSSKNNWLDFREYRNRIIGYKYEHNVLRPRSDPTSMKSHLLSIEN